MDGAPVPKVWKIAVSDDSDFSFRFVCFSYADDQKNCDADLTKKVLHGGQITYREETATSFIGKEMAMRITHIHKIISLFTASAILGGCGASASVLPGNTASAIPSPSAAPGRTGAVAPITSVLDVRDGFNEKGKEMIADVFGDNDSIEQSLLSVGTDAPDIVLNTYDGNTLNLSGLKGKNVVLEVVAYWCQYCQQETKDYLPEIMAENPDVTFVQAFMQGAKEDSITNDDGNTEVKDTIAQFYQDAGTSIPEGLIVTQESDAFESYMRSIIKIESYPCIVFINKDGKISWVREGLADKETFTKMIQYAFGDDPLYENLADGLSSPPDFIRNPEDVKKDLSADAQAAIEELETTDNAKTMAYGNMGMNVTSKEPTVQDMEGKEFNVGALKGITDYLFLTESDKNLTEAASAFTELEHAYPDNNYVILIVPDTTGDGSKVKELLGENAPSGTYLDAYSSIPDGLYPLLLYETPTIVYVNEDQKLSLGSHSGDFSIEALKKAQDLFTGENPVCTWLK